MKNVETKLTTPIKNLDLSEKTIDILLKNGIRTIGDLLNLSVDDLMNLRDLGSIRRREVMYIVHSLGYKFKNELEETQTVETNTNDEPNSTISAGLIVNNSEIDLSQLEINQIKENDEISKRIAKKEELLEKYNKLIEEKRLLLEREKELDNKIAEAIQTLNKLNSDNNGKGRK